MKVTRIQIYAFKEKINPSDFIYILEPILYIAFFESLMTVKFANIFIYKDVK